MSFQKLIASTALLIFALLHQGHAEVVIKGNVTVRIQGGGAVIINNGAAGGVVVTGNAASVVAKPDTRPKRTPAVEKALNEFAAKVALAKRKQLEQGMVKVVDEVVKVSQADEAAKAKLEAGAKKAIDETTALYPDKLIDWLSRWTTGTEEEALAQIRQWPEDDSANWPVSGVIAPADQPIWAETIKASLNPEQFAAWDKLASEKSRKLEEEITRYLKPNAERMKDQFKAGMDTVTSDVATVLSLSADRLAKLKTAAAEAVTRSVEAWRDAQAKAIRAMGETERRQIFSREGGSYSTGSSKLQRPEYQPEWKDSLKAALSEDEFQRLETAHKERSARRNQAFALLLISELDKRIGLTASQRDSMLPLALKPSRNLIKMNSTDEEEPEEESFEGVTQWNLQPANFIAAALKMPEADMRVILDSVQWTRWQDYCKSKPENSYQRRVVKLDADQTQADLEGLVNEYLHKSARDQEQRFVKGMLVRVEDAARIVKLQPEAVAQLSLAARGAVERTMGTWRNSLEDYLNNNLQGVRADEFRTRIAGLGNLAENISRDKNPQEHPLWTDTIKATLTTEQNEIWQKELDARSAYRDRATAALAISELDRRRRLTTEQFNKLEPLIINVVKDYSPDITRYLSNDWQLRSYYLLVPLTAIPETQLKTILSADQAKLMKERDLAQVQSYWDGIKNYHEQRLKEKKQPAQPEQ
jgi:hypothetical protein